MCGIAGMMAGDPSADVTAALAQLTSNLSHRGPDGQGFHFFQGRSGGLGHRRLSIVDVACGAQPMANEDGTVWTSYNGEIYNHLDIRRELESLGHRFHTAADTEVIVHGWEEWGPGVFERLNGIYALAIHDGRAGRERVILARDPVGVKPLYLGQGGPGWWFASELAAASRAGLVDPRVRPGALGEFLVYRFIPSPGTFYRNTWKIPPGHWCEVPVDRPGADVVFQRFETRFKPATLPTSEPEWEEEIRAELTAAVRRQLMSDVPVGSLLSGGVDSTVITRLMKEGLGSAPQSFAVGMTGAGAVNELEPARRAARALEVPLTEVEVSDEQFLSAWPSQISSFGEPVANSGVLLVGLLCRTVGQTHKVVLTGQGADEPLGGYPRHSAERWYPLTRALGPLLGMIPDRWATGDRVERIRRLSREPDRARRFAEILAVFSPAEVSGLSRDTTDRDALAAPVRQWLAHRNGNDSLNSLLRVDVRLSLADDLLLVADHMSMASSVELRVPFLDLRLLALFEAMPSRYKVSARGERKWLYRQAVKTLLPEPLRTPLTGYRERTGRKLGFTTPVERWLTRWAMTGAREYLLGKDSQLPGHLEPAALSRVLDESNSGRPRVRQLLSLYVLETWLRAVAGAAVEEVGGVAGRARPN
jgi:asparagine synthase (glutamine-hydrolysing)